MFITLIFRLIEKISKALLFVFFFIIYITIKYDSSNYEHLENILVHDD